jgi:hypothetical protein
MTWCLIVKEKMTSTEKTQPFYLLFGSCYCKLQCS